MTQIQLAEAIGASQRDISLLESGKITPKPEMVSQLAGALGCDVNDLLSWQPESQGLEEGADSGQLLLPLRGVVPFSGFEWPKKRKGPGELVSIPPPLFEGHRILLKAGDDSMEPEIHLHDICVFDPTVSPVHGCIACMEIGSPSGKLCVVRWYLDTGDAIVLMPADNDDPESQPLAIVRTSGGGFRLLGEPVKLEVKGVLTGLIRSYFVPSE